MRLFEFLGLSLSCAACALPGLAGDVPVVDEDADLPQPFDASAAQSLLESSPFTRSLNLSDSLTLTGIAYVEGKPVATLLDRATKQSFIVSEEPNPQGWKLAGATPDPELRHTQVKIMVGPEIVTVRYGEEQLAPEHARRSPGAGPPVQSSSIVSSSKTQYKSSSYLGENGRDRFNALSDQARERFKDSMHKLIDKHPEMTPDQRATYAEKYYARVVAEDQKQAAADAGGKSSKAPKISKSVKGK